LTGLCIRNKILNKEVAVSGKYKKGVSKISRIKIRCPKCEVEGSISLTDAGYQGPYRCWKCRQNFTIEIKNDQLKSCEPLSEAEFKQQQEIAALKARFKQG